MTTGTATGSSSSSSSSAAAVATETSAPAATVPPAASAKPAAEPVAETLTLGDLHNLLIAMGDRDAYIYGASKARMYDLCLTRRGDKTTQQDTWGVTIETADLKPSVIGGHYGISFMGDKVRAGVLLDALETCVATHGGVRVCMDGKRALSDRPFGTCFVVPTDSLMFVQGPHATADLDARGSAVRLAETLVASGKVDMEVIATAASSVMPFKWLETRYYLEGALLASLQDRLPGLCYDEDIDRLFDRVGPTEQEASKEGHGRFVIMVPIGGLTYKALAETYGPNVASLSKVDRLVAAAAAAVNAPAKASDSPA
ncbi:hypothetical protein psal_cds_50 [Pandoravirus salinus]|uniref:Uncharacterized protein n=1 Tax=Pandoravirus salinus TaxID=1349410 RepID=S4VVK0_9VIRU|nr:hypothetical protein psal_cds_50 [Pandoravirus salinus]AGO83441.1 hypothetical protein psal_cds_50 [Pandoravirus salinus]